MADPNAGIPVRVILAPNALRAEIVIPPVLDAENLTEDHVLAALREHEIEINDDVRQRVRDALQRLEPGSELRATVAEAEPPAHAEPGRVDWLVGPEADPIHATTPAPRSTDDTDAEQAPDDDDDGQAENRVDHYDRTTYTMVSRGQHLATIIPPTEGRDGRDVKGRPIRAKNGKPARVRHDDSISLTEDNTLIAEADGVLSRSLGKWFVRDYLQIPGYVDFSTGNIDFTGDIEVIRGVRDCFLVRAEGNLEIQGLVEAAHLHTGGDLYARGGVAARDRGTLNVKGDLVAKYLDSARVDVGGSLHVLREIINCSAVVHTNVESPNATLMGGTLTPAGRVRLATVGSPAGARTHIVLGTVPALEPKLAESRRLIEQLLEQVEKLPPESEQHRQATRRLTQLEQTHDRLRETIEARRTVDLWVSLVLHAGAVLALDQRLYVLREDLPGPVTIRHSRADGLIYQRGKSGDPTPLIRHCDPDVRTAA